MPVVRHHVIVCSRFLEFKAQVNETLDILITQYILPHLISTIQYLLTLNSFHLFGKSTKADKDRNVMTEHYTVMNEFLSQKILICFL